MGVAGYSEMAHMLGLYDVAEKYAGIAKKMAVKWEEMAKVPGKFTDPRQLSGLGVDPLTWYNYDQSTPVTTLPSEQEMLTTWLGRLDFKTVEIENYLNGVETNWDDIVFQTALQQYKQ